MIAKTQYENALREHQTYVLLQRSLIALVQDSIETKYTNAIRNRITGQLPGDICLVKTHLFSTYGKINEQELQTKYDKTTKMSYHVSDPIDDIYNAVEDLCEIADLAETPYSPRQQVNIGYLIVNKLPIFRSDLRKWMRKPIADKTWLNFMAHFRQAHQELRDTDTSMEELGYQSANALVEQIVERLREEDDTIASPTHPDYVIPPVHTPPLPPIPTTPPPLPPQPYVQPPTTQQQANAVVPIDPNAAVMQAMMNNMQMMHDTMHQNFRHGRGRGRGRVPARGRGRGRGRSGNRNRGERTNQYCHSHGNCAHTGRECETPAEGHQIDATFANLMGGSTNRCYWLLP